MFRRKRKLLPLPIYISGALLVTAVFGLLYPTGFQTAGESRNVEWMKGISDNTSIRNINIPGTHDTMALYDLANIAGKCQSLSLGDQLNIGIRFLDIRLREDGDRLYATHGYVDQKETFENIISITEQFLNKHPSEFILMSVKEDDDAKNSTLSFEEAVKTYETDKWVTSNSLPEKIGDVRGKIVLLSRFTNTNYGVDMSNGWLDSKSFTLPNDSLIQDEYKISDIEEKKQSIINNFNESGHALKINFLSGYVTSGFPPSSAPTVAKHINPWINEEINKYNDRGIVLYDFVTTREMDAWFK